MNQHDDFDVSDDEFTSVMQRRRMVLASLLGGFAMPLLPNAPWAPGSGVMATHPPRHLANGVRCGDDDIVFPITDPVSVVKAALAVSINAIPVVGGILGAIFELLWPASGMSVWDQIKDNVTKLVHGAIEDEMLRRLDAVVRGLEDVARDHLKRIRDHMRSNSPDTRNRLEISIEVTNKLFIEKLALFKNDAALSLRARCQILPLYAQLANLHLVFLRDAAVNAAAYGFDVHGTEILLEDFLDALKNHEKHVDTVLPTLFDALRAEYEANRDKIRVDDSNGFGAPGWSATGAWESKKIENNTRSLLVDFVEDYRKLWPHMEPGAAPAPLLTRELWFGPYGVPDCSDINCIPRLHHDGHWVFDRKPEVVMPASNPGRAIRHISVPQIDVKRSSSVRWRFPRNFEVYREGDGLTPPSSNIFGISLAPQWGGPVVGIRVDTALYISRSISKDCATGYLVSGVYFKQHDGRTHSVGSSGDVAREIKGYSGEDAPVPAGHILHEIHQCSTVRGLYRNLGKDAPPGTESVGSVMFSFKLADPALHLKDELLRRVFVASPTQLSANDLVDMELRLEGANPKAASPSKRAGLRSQVEHEMEAEHLVGDREAFWRRIDAITGD